MSQSITLDFAVNTTAITTRLLTFLKDARKRLLGLLEPELHFGVSLKPFLRLGFLRTDLRLGLRVRPLVMYRDDPYTLDPHMTPIGSRKRVKKGRQHLGVGLTVEPLVMHQAHHLTIQGEEVTMILWLGILCTIQGLGLTVGPLVIHQGHQDTPDPDINPIVSLRRVRKWCRVLGHGLTVGPLVKHQDHQDTPYPHITSIMSLRGVKQWR